ncbi:MAG TPA: hypothetical protein VME24_00400 [Alphaproteobacteria bacterium]|nr:hypothetical protein [Alphaproteobacteria bacterium]
MKKLILLVLLASVFVYYSPNANAAVHHRGVHHKHHRHHHKHHRR